MISCYRRIPRLFSNNIRTFCDSSKLLPRKDDNWTDRRKSYTLRNSKERNDVRFLFISNPDSNLGSKVLCAFQIGTGSYDEKEKRPGLAHLLEHVVAMGAMREHDRPHCCRTDNFTTVFAWIAEYQTLLKEFETWSKLLFSTHKLETIRCRGRAIKEIMEKEVECVDNEFHESRIKRTNAALIVEILYSEGMRLFTFSMGTRDTLGEISKDFMTDIEELRKHYRRRPVSVCVYSKTNLKQPKRKQLCDLVLKFLDNEQSYVTTSWHYQVSKEYKKRLFVLKSDDGALEFSLFFPWTKILSKKNMNTFRFLGQMMKCEVKGCLAHYLLAQKMGTVYQIDVGLYGFRIILTLTANGLTKIPQVSSAVHEYLHFLHKNWTNLSKYQYREILDSSSNDPTIEYVQQIVDSLYFIEPGERIYETDLNQTLPLPQELALISDQILKNDNFVHIISARDHNQVLHVLDEQIKVIPEAKSDKTYMTDYYVYETQLPKLKVNAKFELENLTEYKKVAATTDNMRLHVYVTEPKDVVFQALYAHTIVRRSAHIWAKYFPMSQSTGLKLNTNGVVVPLPNDEIKAYFKAYFKALLSQKDDSNTEGKEDFLQCKEHVMSRMSQVITSSESLARSLMETVVGNIHSINGRWLDPVPMQYQRLKDMDYRVYEDFLAKQSQVDFNTFQFAKTDPLASKTRSAEFIIKSINNNELVTITLAFYKTLAATKTESKNIGDIAKILDGLLCDVQDDRRLYTATCGFDKFSGVQGICFNIKSVEGKDRQSSEDILKAIDDIMNIKLPDELKKKGKAFKVAYGKIKEHKIIIQIKGNKKISKNTGLFEDAFKDWYEMHLDTFQKITDI